MSESIKPSRIRSPAYPSINLKLAVGRVEELYNFGKRSPVLVSAVLPKWGYKPKSANGMKVVAALKSYGLIDVSGKLDMRKIQLTDSAYRIIHDQKHSPERLKAIREAALNPEIYQYCWDEFRGPKHMPHDDAIRSHLILEKRFNETAVSGFLADYKETVEYAKLEDDDTILNDDGKPEVSVGDWVQWEFQGITQFPTAKQITSVSENGDFVFVDGIGTGIPIAEVEIVDAPSTFGNVFSRENPSNSQSPPPPGGSMRQDTFTLNEGQVVIQWPSELTIESFQDFTDWLEILHRKIGRSVEAETKPKLVQEDPSGNG